MSMEKHPTKIGSSWQSKQGLFHGPRLISPKKFKRFYLKDQAWVRKNRNRIANYSTIEGVKLPENTKIVTGVLKKSPLKKQLAIQSFIGVKLPKVRVRAHTKKSHGRRVYVRSFIRRVRKSKRI